MLRVTYGGKSLPLTTHAAIDHVTSDIRTPNQFFADQVNDAWELLTGEPKTVLWDNYLNGHQVKLYPIADINESLKNIDQQYGVTSTTDADEDVYGIIDTGVDDYGNAHLFEDQSGWVAETLSPAKCMKIYYLQMTSKLTNMETDNLQLPSRFDHALKYYVAGQTLTTDNDATYAEKASQLLTAYSNLVSQFLTVGRRDIHQTDALFTSYRSGI